MNNFGMGSSGYEDDENVPFGMSPYDDDGDQEGE